jgi:type I restriction enzyme, S subunit
LLGELVGATTFSVELGDVEERLDPGFAGARHVARERLSGSPFPLIALDDVLLMAQYGTSERANSSSSGVPVLRMGNLTEEGLDVCQLKRIPLSDQEIAKYRLDKGDVLVNRTNSKELVGKCAVFELEGLWVFASYLVRLRVDTKRVLPHYVARFLMSAAGRAQIDQLSRQAIGMANLNLQELRGMLMPLPPLDVQQRLSSAVESAWAKRKSLFAEAEQLNEGRKMAVADTLQLKLKSVQPRATFAIPLAKIRGRRMDVAANRPGPTLRTKPSYSLVALGGVASVDGETVRSLGLASNKNVPYVGLPDCSLTSIERIGGRPAGDLASASLAREGDILFARIEPSVFNQKYVFVDALPAGTRVVATSGEFYVVRAIQSLLDSKFLYAVLFTEFVTAQVRGFTTGSSGRQRLPRELFTELLIPCPPLKEQRRIGERFLESLQRARMIRAAALLDWESARENFESGFRG